MNPPPHSSRSSRIISASALADQRFQSDNLAALSMSDRPESYYADMNVNSLVATSSGAGGILSSVTRPDRVAETSSANDTQTKSEVDDADADALGGGFDIFMSGVTIHFKPIRYDNIRDWVVNKLGGVYAGIQNAGIADMENGLIFPSFVRRLSEDDSSHIHNDDGRDTDDVLSPESGGELSFLFNTVSGIYYFLNPSDDRTEPQGSETHTSGREISALLDVTSAESAEEDQCSPEVHTSQIEESAGNSQLQPELLNSFDSSSFDEDYDVLYMNEDERTLEATKCGTSRNLSTSLVTENAGDQVTIEGRSIDESDIWEVVSHDDADDWDIAVSPSR
ncbi:hypothetical protein V1525DRAFT_405096 [Lipomyces kononenkoae]|uniref:Uncharacterized protein n=1 Tax=Lipomyces kononenkoae TaxID=34357 RepID=A0ACC3SZH6_LIPKO